MEEKQFNQLKNILYLGFSILFFLIWGVSIHIRYELKKQMEPIERVVTQFDTVVITSPLEKIITLTVYNPVESQCDDTPLVTANGTKIDLEKLKRGEIKYCAVSKDLLSEIPYGSIIYIEGYGEYEVVDTMNKRIKMGVDILQDVSEKGFKKQNIRILKVK